MATALAVTPARPHEIAETAWQEAGWLPGRLAADIPVRGFTLGDLLSLEVGAVVDAGISTQADLSVWVNGARIGCGKLDSSGTQRGLRLTELL